MHSISKNVFKVSLKTKDVKEIAKISLTGCQINPLRRLHGLLNHSQIDIRYFGK
jgi:hypothetical protein